MDGSEQLSFFSRTPRGKDSNNVEEGWKTSQVDRSSFPSSERERETKMDSSWIMFGVSCVSLFVVMFLFVLLSMFLQRLSDLKSYETRIGKSQESETRKKFRKMFDVARVELKVEDGEPTKSVESKGLSHISIRLA